MFGPLNINKVACDVADAFCAQLPNDRFLDEEITLLELLKEVAGAVKAFLPHGVSLQDWAARRVPEEEATDVNASRMVYVGNSASVVHRKSASKSEATQPAEKAGQSRPPQQHGNMPARASEIPRYANNSQPSWRDSSSVDAFFDSLPPDSFLPWEVQMKEALFKAFKKRRHGPAADRPQTKLLTALTQHPLICPLLEEALPAGVSLEDWLLRRVGGEFDIHVDIDGNKIVVKKFHQLTEEEGEALKEERAQQMQDFINSLPEDSFSAEEIALRDAIFAFIDSWSGSTAPTTNDLGNDAAVQNAKVALLPMGISVKRWCESRIGEEVEFLQDDSVPGTLITVGYPGQWGSGALKLLANQHKKKRRIEG